jgi:hypothetical protein
MHSGYGGQDPNVHPVELAAMVHALELTPPEQELSLYLQHPPLHAVTSLQQVFM